MNFTHGIGETPQPSDSRHVGATFGTSWAARTGSVPRNSWLACGTIGDIAMDTAKVSLAGAMISQATRGSDVRFEKVAALQQTIAAGSYSVSSATLADKLIGVLLK